MKRGIVYLAIGERHYSEAIRSAESVKAACDLPIALVSDLPESGGPFDLLFTAEDEDTHTEKVRAIINTPFEQTLYLDTDTLVLRRLDAIFDLLDKFDLCAVVEDYAGHEGIPPTLPVFNSGVLAYNADAMQATFARWLELVQATNGEDGDQKFLRQALWEYPVKVAPLSRCYNFRCDYPWQVWGRVAILHGRRHIGAAAEHVNDSMRLRLWRPMDERIEVLR